MSLCMSGLMRRSEEILLVLLSVLLSATSSHGFGAQDALSLDDAVSVALRNSPRIGAAQARVGQADARLGSAVAQRGFRLNFTSTDIKQGPELFFPGRGTVVPGFRYDHGFLLQTNLFDGGRREAQQRAAEFGTGISRNLLQQTRDDVSFDAKVAFLEVLRARQLKDVSQETLKAAEEHLRVSQSRFKAGLVPRFDVLRSEAEVEDARQRLITDETAVELAESQFNTVLNRPVNTPVEIRSVGEPPAVSIDLPQALQAAARHRPELLALPQQVEVAHHEVRAARSGWRPSLDVLSAYDRRSSTTFTSNYTYAFTALVQVPLFDSGLTRAQVAEARQIFKETEQRNESIRQRVDLEVKQATLNLVRARQRRIAAEKELAAARESLRVAQVRYNSGVGTNLEVLDARVAAARAESNSVNALYDYHVAVAQLEHAMGMTVKG